MNSDPKHHSCPLCGGVLPQSVSNSWQAHVACFIKNRTKLERLGMKFHWDEITLNAWMMDKRVLNFTIKENVEILTKVWSCGIDTALAHQSTYNATQKSLPDKADKKHCYYCKAVSPHDNACKCLCGTCAKTRKDTAYPDTVKPVSQPTTEHCAPCKSVSHIVKCSCPCNICRSSIGEKGRLDKALAQQNLCPIPEDLDPTPAPYVPVCDREPICKKAYYGLECTIPHCNRCGAMGEGNRRLKST